MGWLVVCLIDKDVRVSGWMVAIGEGGRLCDPLKSVTIVLVGVLESNDGDCLSEGL